MRVLHGDIQPLGVDPVEYWKRPEERQTCPTNAHHFYNSSFPSLCNDSSRITLALFLITLTLTHLIPSAHHLPTSQTHSYSKMVLADLGRKINGAIQSMSKASVIDDKVRSAYPMTYHCREWIVNETVKWAQDSDINNNLLFSYDRSLTRC